MHNRVSTNDLGDLHKGKFGVARERLVGLYKAIITMTYKVVQVICEAGREVFCVANFKVIFLLSKH